MSSIDVSVLVGYLLLVMGALFFVRPARSMNDFALGGRSFPSLIAFATLAATAIGPGFTTGLMGKAAGGGLIWVVVFCFFSLQMLITGLFLAPRLRNFPEAVTLGDIMGARYGRVAQGLTGVITVLFSAGIVGAIAKVSGTFIHTLLGIDATLAIVVSTCVVILYSAFGGIKADVLTDVLQFAILAIGIPLILLLELPRLPADFELSTALALSFNAGGMDMAAFAGLAFSFFFGEFLLPPYAARAMSARSPGVARRAFILAAAFSAIWFLCMGIIGVLGRIILPDVPADALFMALVQALLPPGVLGLVVAALTAIIASSQDSFLNSAAVALTRDIMRRPTGAGLLVTKGAGILVGLVGMLIGLYVPSIVEALLLAYSVWAPTIVVPLVAALVFRRVAPIAGLAAMVGGGVTTLGWTALGEPMGVPGLMAGMAASLLAFCLGSILSPNPGASPGTPAAEEEGA